MPSLETLHQRFQQDPFLLLSIDVGEKDRVVRKFIEKRDLSFPILLDRDQTVAVQYGIRSHPMAYLINPDGKIVGVAPGYQDWDHPEIGARIASLLPEGFPDIQGD